MTKVTNIRRPVAGVKSIGTVPFSRVLAAYERGSIDIQRDHDKRALRANYLGEQLTGEQLLFRMVIYRGVERLVDGYTRVSRIVGGMTQEPLDVMLIVYDEVYDKQQLKRVYDSIDSPSSTKRAEDRFDEGVRSQGMMRSYTSHLVLNGPKTAPSLATGISTVRESVEQCKKGMMFVDSLKLSRNGESVGMLAAYYAIGQYASLAGDEADKFIRQLNQQFFEPKKPTPKDMVVMQLRKFQDAKRIGRSLSGKANGQAVLHRVLAGFVQYLGYERLLKGATHELSLPEFKLLMAKLKLTDTLAEAA